MGMGQFGILRPARSILNSLVVANVPPVEMKSLCSDYEFSLRSDFPKQFCNQDQLIQGRFLASMILFSSLVWFERACFILI